MESHNVMDKYAFCIKKNTFIVGHLPLGKNGKFAKMIFYFLRADQDADYKVVITGNKVSLGDVGRNGSSLQNEDLRPKKNGENSL